VVVVVVSTGAAGVIVVVCSEVVVRLYGAGPQADSAAMPAISVAAAARRNVRFIVLFPEFEV
jgi:hypothetical protein